MKSESSLNNLSAIVTISTWLLLYFSNFAETFTEQKGIILRDQFKEFLKPKNITVIRNNKLIQVSQSDLIKSDLIKISAGDTILVNGEVIQGIATIDESPITGESATIYKENIDGRNQILSGSKVVADSLLYRPYLDGSQNSSSIIKLSKTSHNEKAITIFLSGITFINIAMALSFFSVLKFIGIPVSFEFIIAFIVCIIPTTAAALMGTVSISGSKKLLRNKLMPFNPNIVDIASDINLIVFDKTGTITTGMRELDQIIVYDGVNKNDFIKSLYLSSFKDETTEGQSICAYLRAKHSKLIDTINTSNCEIIPFNSTDKFSGCITNNDTIRKGAISSIENIILKKDKKIDRAFNQKLINFAQKGFTPIVLIKNNKILGACILKDELKEGIKSRISKIKSMGIKAILLTGDSFHIAQNYSEEAGFDQFYSDATPEDKKNIISQFKENGYIVGMCGEGVNDNLALIESDLGFSCIDADITTRNASDVIDLDNDPLKIIQLIEISRNLLSTKGCITTFSLMSDIAKYFAILPAILLPYYPELIQIDILGLHNAESAIASSIIFNSLIVILFLPLAFKGVKHLNYKTLKVVKIFFLIFGIGGLIIPFFGIKVINMLILKIFI